jgi:hypothetical protein
MITDNTRDIFRAGFTSDSPFNLFGRIVLSPFTAIFLIVWATLDTLFLKRK